VYRERAEGGNQEATNRHTNWVNLTTRRGVAFRRLREGTILELRKKRHRGSKKTERTEEKTHWNFTPRKGTESKNDRSPPINGGVGDIQQEGERDRGGGGT